MNLVLPLPGKKLSPNSRCHPIAKASSTRRHREAAFFATLKALGVAKVPTRILRKDAKALGITKAGRNSAFYQRLSSLLHPDPPPTFTRYALTFHFPTARDRDDDNAAATFKAYRDGIADALRVNDSTFILLHAPSLYITPEAPRLEVELIVPATESPSDNAEQLQWIDAGKWLPMGPHCVLATDMETHFIAVWDGIEWSNAWTDEAIDSFITHWMELPDPPAGE